ncbi:MAG: haloacid dehalogenase-like hydrolase [Acidobacteriia bacterium]|nr:haloacid dehalogenase-like hydrolase [Terriglobia bacterium]
MSNPATRSTSNEDISPSAQQFIESVLNLRPRIAVFDCDGTLWQGDSGADFFYWQIGRGMVPDEIGQWAIARYDDYKAGNVDEETMCGEMVTINAGVPESVLEEAAEEFFSSVVQGRIFPEMQELTRRLAAIDCSLWAVSSTNVWSIRAGVKQFGIPPDHVLGASVHIQEGRATGQLIRVPTGPGKAKAIHEVVQQRVDVCFGNSVHDAAMLEIAEKAFAVNPNPDLEARAKEKGWKIYWPAGTK